MSAEIDEVVSEKNWSLNKCVTIQWQGTENDLMSVIMTVKS